MATEIKTNDCFTSLLKLVVTNESIELQKRVELCENGMWSNLIVEAITCQSLECVEILAKHNPEGLNNPVPTKFGEILLLHYTVQLNAVSLAEILLDAGASILHSGQSDIDAIQLAIRLAESSVQYEEMATLFVKRLKKIVKELSSAIDRDDAALLSRYFQPSPSLAFHFKSVPKSPNSGTFQHLLHRCAESNGLSCATHLIACGAQSSCQSHQTPLHAACHHGNAAMVLLLLQHFPSTANVPHALTGRLPLHAAVVSGSTLSVHHLLYTDYPPHSLAEIKCERGGQGFYKFPFCIDHHDATGITPFLLACQLNRVEIVQLLLVFRLPFHVISPAQDASEAGDDVMKINPTQYRSRSLSQDSLCPIDLEIFASVSYVCRSPLHIAVKNNCHALAQLLLSSPQLASGINSLFSDTPTDNTKRTPLDIAVCETQDISMVNLLLSYGARDINDSLLVFIIHKLQALDIPDQSETLTTSLEEIVYSLLRHSAYKDNASRLSMDYSERNNCGDIMSDVPSPPTKAVFLNWSDKQLRSHYITEPLLRSVALHHNPHLPPSLPSMALLRALSRIDLSGNPLNNLPCFPLLLSLTNLQELMLSRTQLTSFPDDSESPILCPSLMHFDISGNKLTSLPDWIFSSRSLPLLDTLNVSANRLRGLPFKMWTAPKLRLLNASRNLLDGLPMSPSSNLARLGSCSAPPMAADFQASFRERSISTSVDSCLLSGGDATLPRAALLFDLTSLSAEQLQAQRKSYYSTSLVLREDNSTDAPSTPSRPSSDAGLLTKLVVSHNHLTSIPRVLACLAPCLTSLDLSHNQLTTPGHLYHFPTSLTHLDLSFNLIKSMESWTNTDDMQAEPRCWLGKLFSSTMSGSDQLSMDRGSDKRSLCPHRHPTCFPSLVSFSMEYNRLTAFSLRQSKSDPDGKQQDYWNTSMHDLLFPHLTSLDLSRNAQLTELPQELGLLKDLSLLNIAYTGVQELPHSLSRLSNLQLLKLSGSPVESHLSTVLSPSPSSQAVLSYLASVDKQGQIYNKLRVMIIGSEGIGKTSLLRSMKKMEGALSKSEKSSPVDTAGVDISDFPMRRKIPSNWNRSVSGIFCEDVQFVFWDFKGGHQLDHHHYLFSKRALYLVVWNINDAENGLKTVHETLINIQCRSPNALVVIVGTHLDAVQLGSKELRLSFLSEMQREVHRRFIDVLEPHTVGLPRVRMQFHVSSTKETNIKLLCSFIHQVANEMLLPGSRNTRAIGVEVPSLYLELEHIIKDTILPKLKQSQKGPILSKEEYQSLVLGALHDSSKTLCDTSQLDQATSFLHDVGIVNHYSDMDLNSVYLLDPQWLCHLVASVIHAASSPHHSKIGKAGFMEISSLTEIIKNCSAQSDDVSKMIMSLLSKFELAVLIDQDNVLLPSQLPSEYQCLLKRDRVTRKIRIKEDFTTRTSLAFTLPPASTPPMESVSISNSTFYAPFPRPRSVSPAIGQRTPMSVAKQSLENSAPVLSRGYGVDSNHRHQKLSSSSGVMNKKANNPNVSTSPFDSLTRIYAMTYIPTGFWPRLLTKLISDVTIGAIAKRIYPTHPRGQSFSPYWLPWRTGVELFSLAGDVLAFSVKEIQPDVENRVEYRQLKYRMLITGESKPWQEVKGVESLSFIEVYIPGSSLYYSMEKGETCLVKPKRQPMVQLLAQVIDHIDSLLEDWFPDVGTRFHQTTEGRYLVSRMIPCAHCIESICQIYKTSQAAEASHSWSQVDLIDGYPEVIRGINLHPSDEMIQRHSINPPLVTTPSTLATVSESIATAIGSLATVIRPVSAMSQGDTPASVETVDSGCDSASITMATDSSEATSSSPSTPIMTRASDLMPLATAVANDDDSGLSQSVQLPNQETNELEKNVSRLRRIGGIRKKNRVRIEDKEYVYCVTVEEFICAIVKEKRSPDSIDCFVHKAMNFQAPDLTFEDLNPVLRITSDQVQLRLFIGRGSFGSVFSGLLERGEEKLDVAIKAFVPIDPGNEGKDEDKLLYKEETRRWSGEPVECSCRAHSQVRSELSILTRLSGQPHLLGCYGVLLSPLLALVLPLAPMGSLDKHLADYAKTGNRLPRWTITQILQQVSLAILNLHKVKIIYRDLKAENLLVWSFPSPLGPFSAPSTRPHSVPSPPGVHIVLTDYGISRAAVAEGYRGFAGTSGYMAPEIVQFKGEQTYSEKVDIYSFGMLMYELVTLRAPFQDCQSMRLNLGRHVMAGGRPTLTHKDMNYSTPLLDLMARCWHQDPKERPSADTIYNTITSQVAFDKVKDIFRLDQLTSLTCSLVDRQDKCSLWLGGLYTPVSLCPSSPDPPVRPLSRLCALRIREGRLVAFKMVQEWQGEEGTPVPNAICQSGSCVYCALSNGDVEAYSCIDFTFQGKYFLYSPFTDSTLFLTPLCSLSDEEPHLLLAAVLESGAFLLLTIPFPLTPLCSSVETQILNKDSPACSLAYLPNKKQVWVGHWDGHISLTSLTSTGSCVQVGQMHHPNQAANQSAAFLEADLREEIVWCYLFPGDALYCWSVGSRELVKIIDLQSSRPADLGSVTSLSFLQSSTRLTCTTSNGHVGLFNTSKALTNKRFSRSESTNRISLDSSVVSHVPCHCELSNQTSIFFIDQIAPDSEENQYLVTIGRGYQDMWRPDTASNHKNSLYLVTWFDNDWLTESNSLV